MRKFRILPHTADLKIQAYGKTKEEMFSNALLAMAENQKGEDPGTETKREINIKSFDLASLLVDFLSEALYWSQINKEIYKDVKFKKFTDPSTGSWQVEIEAELLGQKIERFGEDIKAVTYHDLDVHKGKDDIWEATVLFDI